MNSARGFAIAIEDVPTAEASAEPLGTGSDGQRPASCPLCHTMHPSLTHDALESGGFWRCTRCGQHWDARRLATVSAYATLVATQARRFVPSGP